MTRRALEMREMESFHRLLAQHRVVSLATHTDPDGDALGSMLALALWLREHGHVPVCCVPPPLPQAYAFLHGWEMLTPFPEEGGERLEAATLAIALDAADPARLGRGDVALGSRPIVDIDHHATNRHFGTLNLVAEGAAATADLLVDLLTQAGPSAGRPLSATVASNLLTGLVFDTGGFQHSTTSAAVLRKAAMLVDCGAVVHDVAVALFRSRPPAMLNVIGAALAEARLEAGGALLWSSLRQSSLATADLNLADVDGIIDMLNSVAGIHLAVLYKEASATSVKVSLRGRPGLDVAALAAHFGGGGHRRAAGCELSMPLDEAVRATLPTFVAAARRAARREAGRSHGRAQKVAP